ncbi:DoxX family protein [Xanthobacter tagetidis]|jgi:putative oxidoreductase|uniref:DoxX family protein n=1 Tax=Xanthobacter tagetidis TaxID=60216 RepID=A0A3L7ADF5_9HYPH|nr:DoxX family protein [Xanthobacter tagetidis]MBB6309719.1 putative oxidoreductase [Xanthobacter tagetidis]RLP78247.1 DoxX family protein [Xanthobacter tagetidis]
MTDHAIADRPALHLLCRLRRLVLLGEHIPYAVLGLAARVFPAAVFWQSGQTKLDANWRVSENAVYLFQEEYRLPLIDPAIGAHLAAAAEHVFPALLVLGLASRLSALALLGMTAVIQLFVYPDAWPTHGTWAALFLLVVARGPGAISLDHLIGRWAGR